MPCMSPEDEEERALTDSLIRARAEGHKLTDLLCRAGRNYFAGKHLPEDVVAWMEEHCQYDKERGEAWENEPTKSGVHMSLAILHQKLEAIFTGIEEENTKIMNCFAGNKALRETAQRLLQDINRVK